MVAVGVLAVVFVALGLVSRARRIQYLTWVARDRPTALRRGCRVCGAPAVRATWHARGPSYLRPFGPTETVAWCQRPYEQALTRRQALPRRPAQ